MTNLGELGDGPEAMGDMEETDERRATSDEEKPPLPLQGDKMKCHGELVEPCPLDELRVTVFFVSESAITPTPLRRQQSLHP